MKKVIILGAAGRDFHNFNVYFKDNPEYKVVAFTASQIPNIASRIYPGELAGKDYPRGIPIFPEEKLPHLIKKFNVDLVVLSYSDLSFQEVMEKASLINCLDADFCLLGTETMLKSRKKVIAVTAVRTGCGKSPVSRRIFQILKRQGKKAVVIRHPMPYGDLRKQICQRFSSYQDLVKEKCSIEEIEEYQPFIDLGGVVYAGVDYQKILGKAEKEAEIIIWDGGNNDFPFIKPDLWICLVDPLRLGDELTYYPGTINLRKADLVIIPKVNSAKKEQIKKLEENIKKINPLAKIVLADLLPEIENPELIKRKKVLVVEDGPSLTHGNLPFGAGYLIAKKYQSQIIDAKRFVFGSIKEVYQAHPHLNKVLPALGYGDKQLKELEKLINQIKAEAVIIGTPADLRRFIKINKPAVKVNYQIKEINLKLDSVIKEFIK